MLEQIPAVTAEDILKRLPSKTMWSSEVWLITGDGEVILLLPDDPDVPPRRA